MIVKLPVEVERFADQYFAAEKRGEKTAIGVNFRKVDQKALALSCKALFETGAVENMNQLALDLLRKRPGQVKGTHAMRLNLFAKRSGVSYKFSRAYVPRSFDLKAALSQSIQKALQAGITLPVIKSQATEVIQEHTHRVLVTTATTRLQDLMRDTGLTREQLAKIAVTL